MTALTERRTPHGRMDFSVLAWFNGRKKRQKKSEHNNNCHLKVVNLQLSRFQPTDLNLIPWLAFPEKRKKRRRRSQIGLSSPSPSLFRYDISSISTNIEKIHGEQCDITQLSSQLPDRTFRNFGASKSVARF